MYELIDYGFRYGNAKITRIHSDKKNGWIILGVETDKDELQVYVTKTGKIRVSSRKYGEWKPEGRKYNV